MLLGPSKFLEQEQEQESFFKRDGNKTSITKKKTFTRLKSQIDCTDEQKSELFKERS